MPRTTRRPAPTRTQSLSPLRRYCPACRRLMWVSYESLRTVTTLKDVVRLQLSVRRCKNEACELFHKPFRPEAEGQFALPRHEFGLDVIAFVGASRYVNHQTVGEIHRELTDRKVVISERSVTNLLDRYDELVAIALADDKRLRDITAEHGRVILALDGLQPDVGHEVLWVLRDCLSGEVLLARSMLSSTQKDLAELISTVKDGLEVPIEGVLSDGQRSIRNAVAEALPGIPHQLCHFHYLREAAKDIYEADRHAKKELKKCVRGIRPIERRLGNSSSHHAEVVRGYCCAVRSSITDDGRPPLTASGLKLHERLSEVSESLDRVEQKRGSAKNSRS